jgi:hypothetical protein
VDRPHAGKIDDKAVIAKSTAAHIMAAAADSGEKTVCASELDSIDDIGDTRAAGDELRSFVNARIPDLAGVIVAWVLRLEQLTAKCGSE